MVSRLAPSYLDFWYEALAAEFGIVIATSDPEALRQRLYKARRESGDPDLDSLSVRISPLLPNEEIWIVNDKKSRRASRA